jgi:hypothetical protein
MEDFLQCRSSTWLFESTQDFHRQRIHYCEDDKLYFAFNKWHEQSVLSLQYLLRAVGLVMGSGSQVQQRFRFNFQRLEGVHNN